MCVCVCLRRDAFWFGSVRPANRGLQRDEASKKAEELKEKHEAALCAGEDRLREVLGSLHAVEQAFVQHKERYT